MERIILAAVAEYLWKPSSFYQGYEDGSVCPFCGSHSFREIQHDNACLIVNAASLLYGWKPISSVEEGEVVVSDGEKTWLLNWSREYLPEGPLAVDENLTMWIPSREQASASGDNQLR